MNQPSHPSVAKSPRRVPNVNSLETVSQVVQRWRSGEAEPDARGEIERRRQHGALTKEEFIDLVYEEFAALMERGVQVDPAAYPHLFPTYRHSIRRVVEVHQWMHGLDQADNETWPEPGDQVLHYLLMAKLGQGGMGRVFQARNLHLSGRLEVVKISRSLECCEAQIIGRLEHENIVPVHSVTYDDDGMQTLIAMPYCGRATLAHVLDALRESGVGLAAQTAQQLLDAAADSILQIVEPPRLTGSYLDGAVEIARQISAGLAHAHDHQVVHGDIKPSNVLVTPWGQAMLLDFNLSAAEYDDSALVGGTLPYLAPELVQQMRRVLDDGLNDGLNDGLDEGLDEGDRIRPNKLTDVYSLGIVLYELLAGAYPFGELKFDDLPTLVEAMADRQRAPITPVRQCNPAVSEPLSQLVARCLDPLPERRPASVREIEQALNQWRMELALDRQRERAIREEKSRRAAEQRAAAAAARHWWRWGSTLAVVIMATAAVTSGIFLHSIQSPRTPIVAPRMTLVAKQIREHYLLSEEDQALGLIRDTLQVADDDPDLNAAYAYLMLQRDATNSQDYLDHLRLGCEGPYDTGAWVNYAMLIRRKDPQRARQLLQEVIVHNRFRWRPHYILGIMSIAESTREHPLITAVEGAHHMVIAFEKMEHDNRGNPYANGTHYEYAIQVMMKGGLDQELHKVLELGVEHGLKLDRPLELALLHTKAIELPWCQSLLAEMERGQNKLDHWSPLLEPRILRQSMQLQSAPAEGPNGRATFDATAP